MRARAKAASALDLRVAEVFRSIQGETTHAGRPCAFVRLAGCELSCAWCDTRWAAAGGEARTVGSLLDEVRGLGCRLVTVTGGEPLLQPAVHALLAGLCDAGHEVLLETSGAYDVSGVDPRVRRIVDLKCPSSGVSDAVRWEDLGHLRPGDEVKVVVADRADFDWALDELRRRRRDEREIALLWSPVHEVCAPAELARWLLESGAPGRLQLQVHKVLWPDAERGR